MNSEAKRNIFGCRNYLKEETLLVVKRDQG